MFDWLGRITPAAFRGGSSNLPLTAHQTQLILTAVAASATTAGAILALQSHRRHRSIRRLKDELFDTVDTSRSNLHVSRLNDAGLPIDHVVGDGNSRGADVTPQVLPQQQLGTGEMSDEGLPPPMPHPEFLVREQLARNIAFLGEEGMARLRASHVVVVGAGGVGSWATVMLARSGVEYIRVIDFDQVTLSSLNRHAVATLADVGTPKVRALKTHLRQITPQVHIDARVALFRGTGQAQQLQAGDQDSHGELASTADQLILGLPTEDGRPSYVLDCIDNIDTKLDLLQYCHDRGITVISAMGAGAKADPSRIQIADISETFEDPLARSVRRQLKKRGVPSGIPVVYSTEKPGPVKLLPLEESRVEEADDFAVLPEFRARILPVLGTLPAIFGMVMATYVICQLAQFPPTMEPLAIKRRDALYHRLHRDLANRDALLHHHHKHIPLSEEDVAYCFEEVWRGRSAVSGSFEKPALTRWDHRRPLSLQNCVCMTKNEATAHEKLHGPPEDHYPPEVVQRIKERFIEEQRMGQWR
ncbi:hypothetical protein IWQ60_010772 [Tieghemiomyces parasiticus]|uniref:THIF-type NAD/FAD binding fold domain-containing protein n=1 Tax=Tieghemiomyces parasiticus TaxID=78921 RepID=A0A9W7ZPQ1_9FUNG|nr:hypothetical protein IWQ60_010772 [Tieghemiomyces parasiticus]